MDNLVGPYINTKLSIVIEIEPRQMDNNIYKHAKENLKKKIEKRCYGKYGYISEIFDLEFKSEGLIIPENMMSVALFDIVFSCRLCNPIVKKNIVCKIENINSGFIYLTNGPINVVIPIKEIEGSFFSLNKTSGNLLYNNQMQNSKSVGIGEYLKVVILSKRIADGDDVIKTLGKIVDIAKEEEIQKSFSQMYSPEDEVFIDFNDYEPNNTN